MEARKIGSMVMAFLDLQQSGKYLYALDGASDFSRRFSVLATPVVLFWKLSEP
jgi:hypothetical protein